MSAAAAAASSAAVKPVRRFPPPCWTQDEALALIQAYRERWYALRRGYLRTNDWDAVAEEVGRVFPGATPPKTSAQCRHKMEKLRQRYRAEKQRALSFPGGRFLSTWFYFEAMDAMENNGNRSNSDEETLIGNPVNSDVKLVNLKNNQQLSTNLGSVHVGLNPGRGIRFKPAMADQNSVTIAARSNNSRVTNNYAEPEEDDDDDDEDEFENGYHQIETPIGQNSRKIPNFSSQNYATVFHPEHHSRDNIHFTSGFHPKQSSLQDSEYPVFRPRKISKIDSNSSHTYWAKNGEDHDNNGEGEVYRGSLSMEIARNYSERINRNSNNLHFNGDNGGIKNDAIGQMVSSIKLLADGFVKMEKMKMEMAREIEKMRMEAEMKRNEMILESQKQIVEAFVKGLADNKKQQLKSEEI